MNRIRGNHGFSLTEVMLVLLGASILAAAGVPVVTTAMDQYNLVLEAQKITTQLQYSRMRAVSSNEEFRVHFDASNRSYQVETGTGQRHAGPFVLAPGINYAESITFPDDYVTFRPTGNLPASAGGSAGRVTITNRSGLHVDISVSPGGIIQQSRPY